MSSQGRVGDRIAAKGTRILGLRFQTSRRSVKRAEAALPAEGSGPPGITKDEEQVGVGFLLVDRSVKPIYASSTATAILHYPAGSDASVSEASIQERIRSILQTDRFTSRSSSGQFLSGRRRYVWRSFLVESLDPAVSPMFAVMLERRSQHLPTVAEIARRFHLSGREAETVQHLMEGLTTRQAAQRMNVSPNTVKQFIRLIMSKMNVPTRSGIIAKLVGAARVAVLRGERSGADDAGGRTVTATTGVAASRRR